MQYYSTNSQSQRVSFREATIQGQAPDKGLYFPEYIPKLKEGFIQNINRYSREEVALEVIRPYVADTIPKEDLERIVRETIDFEIPLVQVNEKISCLELFHGPTLAFKDVGARFMSRCLGYFVRGFNKKVTVLVATSGDTGGAVANGFFNVEGVDVIILYPSGKVSNVQELQLTTLGGNVTALEVNGTFDDCQRMVKSAFADENITKHLFLTSANSINVARWLPQQFYYFFAYQQWEDKLQPPVISVPSGNFGNICAGLLAYSSGLPAAKFIAACNANDVVPNFFRTGKYKAQETVHTISNAMDVGDPSNFIRILQLFGHNIPELQKVLESYTITDEETKRVMKKVSDDFEYTLDPHGAVAYLCLHRYLEQHTGVKGYFLGTAHPIKFFDVVEDVLHEKIELPEAIQDLVKKKKQSIKIQADNKALKDYLLNSH
ncbi:MAG: threonine synthase [Candidatus Dadabacteria bacterium]